MSLLHQLALISENKIDFISQRQGPALVQAYNQDTGPNKPRNLSKPEEILAALANADPTKNHENLQWLTNQYTKNEFSLEDVRRVKQDIENFYHVRNYLKDKDLLQYNYARLDKEVNPLTSHLPAVMKQYKQEVQGFQNRQVRMAPSQAKFETVREVLKELSKADPTPNKRFMAWIVHQYKDGKISIGNLEEINKQLNELQSSSALKDVDLSTMSPQEVYDLLTKHGDKKKLDTWKPTPEEQKMIDNGDVRVVYQDDQVRIFTPKTWKASCHFGKDTRWCTASHFNSDSHFKSYSKDGPLYIIHTPDGKFQFHFESGQHMNAQDRPAELGALVERYPQIGEVFKELAEKHGVLGMLTNPSEKAMISAVSTRPDRIKELPPKKLNKAIVMAAMDNVDTYHLKDVFGHIQKFRPDLVDDELKLKAIKADPSSIKSLQPKEITREQVKAAMQGKQSNAVVDAFRWLEENVSKLITDDVREDVLKKDGSVLSSIGEKATPGMVSAALSDSNVDHAMAAFKYAMDKMPEKVSDNDIKNMAGRSRFAMKFIPAEKQTKEVVDAALANDIGAFAHVRNPDEDTIVSTIAQGPFMLADNKYIRDKITTDLLKKAVDENPQGVLHELQADPSIEDALNDKVDFTELYKHALGVDGTTLEYVSNQTPELIKIAVQQNPKAWRYADKKIIAKDPVLTKMKQAAQ